MFADRLTVGFDGGLNVIEWNEKTRFLIAFQTGFVTSVIILQLHIIIRQHHMDGRQAIATDVPLAWCVCQFVLSRACAFQNG